MTDTPAIPPPPARPDLGRAQFSDQGKLGPLLMRVYGPGLAAEREAERRTGRTVSSLEDELMAADDFYFSVIDLMDCCWVARHGGALVGAACVNPYIGELQYVAVAPEWRRRGVGRCLVEGVLAELRRRGAGHARIDVARADADAGARAFLAALGFTPIRAIESFGRKP